MKHFKDILNEIGDNPMNITDIDIDPTGGLVAYAEDRKLDIDLKLVANRVDNFDDEVIFEVEFDVNDRMDKTHKGNEIKVFSTVKTIMETWLEDLEEDGIFWSTIEFSASKDGSKKDNTGRERLYARFAKMIAKKYDAKVETKQVNLASIHQIYTKYIIKKNISESNEVQLNEIGDRPMNISKFNITSDGELQAQAIDKELDIKLDLWVVLENLWTEVSDIPEGYYIIDFHVNGSTDKTGTGNEIKVFSSVKAILDRWFNEWKDWSIIEFSASKDGSYEDNTGRERLYARYAKMIANKHGAKVELKKKYGYTVYVIKKNISESNEFQLNEIGDRPMKIDEFDLNKKTGELFAFAAIDGIGLELSIERLTAYDKGQSVGINHEINFLVNHEHEKTGEGNEILIFSTVKAMIKQWLKEYTGWHRIIFTGSKDGSEKKNTGRERLYKRFAQQIAKKYSATIEVEPVTTRRNEPSDGTTFVIVKG